MTRRELPDEWVKVMEPKRLHSLRDLAGALSISPQTASRLVHGEQSSRETIEAAAELLGVPVDRIRQMRNETPLPPFRLPPEADRLGQRQRSAIVAVVRAMLENADAATKSPAAGSAAIIDLPGIVVVPTQTPGLRLLAATFDEVTPEQARDLEEIALRELQAVRDEARDKDSGK